MSDEEEVPEGWKAFDCPEWLQLSEEATHKLGCMNRHARRTKLADYKRAWRKPGLGI